MLNSDSSGVICYWRYKQPSSNNKEHLSNLWELVESYEIDLDGYPLTTPQNTSEGHSRDEYYNWTHEKKQYEDDDYDWVPIPGRAVTIWTTENGVHLLSLNLPDKIVWLDARFIDKLKKLPNWYEFLQCGYDLFMGTAREVERKMHDKPKRKAKKK
jgi:hypothetical protein